MTRPTEKVELGTVMYFLKAVNIDYRPEQLRFGEQNDSVDIYFDDKDLKFQVTTVNGDIIKLIRDKKTDSKTNADEAINKFIINPINNKFKKYRGIDTGNITLLISTINLPPINWLIKENESLNNLYRKSGFKDIYIIEHISERIFCLYKK